MSHVRCLHLFVIYIIVANPDILLRGGGGHQLRNWVFNLGGAEVKWGGQAMGPMVWMPPPPRTPSYSYATGGGGHGMRLNAIGHTKKSLLFCVSCPINFKTVLYNLKAKRFIALYYKN